MLRQTALVAVLAFSGPLAAQEGPSVLFVGHDPAQPEPMFANMATPRTMALHRERTPAFEALLRYHFDEVRVVHAADYTVALSDEYDVTIFDATPKALTEAKRSEDGYVPASYLPLDFDRPAITIAGISDRVGASLGLKLDWL